MGWLYKAINLFSWYSCNLFFRDITVINEQNVPEQGPTIIYGNHNNQFVDGVLLMEVLKRPVHFIAAAKSMRRPLVGHLLRGAGSIPVQRQQDMPREKGEGVVTDLVGNNMKGLGTKFTKMTHGAQLFIEGQPSLKIARVISEVEAEVEGKNIVQFRGQNVSFKYINKLEFTQLYEEVWKSLNNSECIGIFPEGGSHDNFSLLPLKAGICIMALGAMDRYNIPVKIVPCGFNYYNPHKFRSKAILEFGPTYEVPAELLQLYRKDKKKAIAILLQNLSKMLKSVTIQFQKIDKVEQLFAMFTARQLYQLSSKREITPKEKMELNRRFAVVYQKLRDKDEYKEDYQKLLEFSREIQLSGFALRKEDYYGSKFVDFFKFIYYAARFLLRFVIAVPGFLMFGPTTTLIAYLAEKERLAALRASKVKKNATDVVGSYKIILSTYMMPLTCAVHSLLLYFGLKKFTKIDPQTILKLAIGLFAVQPIYALLLVKSYDSFKRSAQKVSFLFKRFFRKNAHEEFNKKKRDMQKRVLAIVEEEGKKVIQNFEQSRILKKEDIQQSESQFYIFDKDDAHEHEQ